jgi:hypothetical protein
MRSEWSMPDGHLVAILGLCCGIRPCNVFEWGAGETTPILRDALFQWGGNLISVENSPEWAAKAGAHLVEDRDKYVNWPLENMKSSGWDLAIVDGRWRSRCLRAIHGRARFVALHDAQRPYYHEAAALYGEPLLNVGHSDGRELWIMSCK